MDQSELLSGLIGDIYDAALQPSLWEGVLAKSAQFVGGPAAGLCSKDTASMIGHVMYASGIDPHFQQLYFEKYVKLAPLTIGQ